MLQDNIVAILVSERFGNKNYRLESLHNWDSRKFIARVGQLIFERLNFKKYALKST